MSKLAALLVLTVSSVAAAEEPRAEQRFKNIKVLKGMPAAQLDPAMEVMSGALGVGCDYCHVERHGGPPAMDDDDKQAKRTARKMIVMMQKINHDYFDGDRVVTCATCHNGRPEPRNVPPLERVASNKGDHGGTKPPAALTVQQLLDRWVQASGGAAAWGKLRTRAAKGTISGFGPQPFGVTILQAAPETQRFTLTMPNGTFEQAWDGAQGWRAFGGRTRPLDEIDATRREAQLAPPLTLAKLLTGLKVSHDAPLEKGTAHVIEGRQGDVHVRLWLDTNTGLLARLVVRHPTPVGDLVSQVDYGDYRAVDGVKLPFLETIRTGGDKRTQAWIEIKHNVPIAPDAFAPPRASAPPPGK